MNDARTRLARVDGPVRLAPRVFLLDKDDDESGLPAAVLALRTVRSRAFGDGSHPTTRLCARALDELLRARPAEAVLDVGTGTGVIARLARAHGVTFVIGTDIDVGALASAQANAALDAHPVDILFANAAPDAWGARFDVVVANILSPVLCALAAAIAAAAREGGCVFLSGLTRPEMPSVKVAYAAHGFVVVREHMDDEWVLLVLARAR